MQNINALPIFLSNSGNKHIQQTDKSIDDEDKEQVHRFFTGSKLAVFKIIITKILGNK